MRLIYRIEFELTSKVYIGQTGDLKKRRYTHINRARSGLNRPLYNAIRKHGEQAFKLVLIEECDESMVDEREKYWITHYQSTNIEHGYNLASGGKGCFTQSEETKKK